MLVVDMSHMTTAGFYHLVIAASVDLKNLPNTVKPTRQCDSYFENVV